MKKITLLAAFALFSNSLFSQQWNGSSNSTDHISRDGNVSIGTNINADKFNLSGNLRLLNGTIKLGLNFADLGNSFYDIESINGGLYIHPSYPTGSPTIPLQSKTLVLSSSHKIGLGTDTFTCNDCTDYRLFVKDGIKTEKVKVEIAVNNGWADYVFKKDYKLMPLKDLQNYIDEKGHLPEVPTTNEAIANGIELKEMNILLLKKIEELTLYTLQQQKNIDEQNQRIQSLEKKLNK